MFVYILFFAAVSNSFNTVKDLVHFQQADHINRGITVITGVWLLPGTLHSVDNYIHWMKSFFAHVDCELVVYADANTSQTIFSSVSPTDSVVFVEKNSPFDFPCLNKYEHDYRNVTKYWRSRHLPELYAIWNAKTCMVMDVVTNNPFKSTYFFWVDIGAFRESESSYQQKIHYWPDDKRVAEVFKGRDKEVLLGLRHPYDSRHASHDPLSGPTSRTSGLIQGGFFGGTAVGIQKYYSAFWRLHGIYLAKGMVCRDQDIMTMVPFELKDSIMIPLWHYRTQKPCGNTWVYFIQFLAREEDRSDGCPLIDLVTPHEIMSKYSLAVRPPGR